MSGSVELSMKKFYNLGASPTYFTNYLSDTACVLCVLLNKCHFHEKRHYLYIYYYYPSSFVPLKPEKSSLKTSVEPEHFEPILVRIALFLMDILPVNPQNK